jgi:hypothetical protein
MINLSGLTIDIFDIIRESKIPEQDLGLVMLDILNSLHDHGVIDMDDNVSELYECENIHPQLTDAIAEFNILLSDDENNFSFDADFAEDDE